MLLAPKTLRLLPEGAKFAIRGSPITQTTSQRGLRGTMGWHVGDGAGLVSNREMPRLSWAPPVLCWQLQWPQSSCLAGAQHPPSDAQHWGNADLGLGSSIWLLR